MVTAPSPARIFGSNVGVKPSRCQSTSPEATTSASSGSSVHRSVHTCSLAIWTGSKAPPSDANLVWKWYFVLNVQPNKVQADWFHLSSVTDETGVTESWAASAASYHADPKVVLMDAPERDARGCEFAPTP